MTRRCPWWRRWFHALLRAADRERLAHYPERPAKARLLRFDATTDHYGIEHWCCPCGNETRLRERYEIAMDVWREAVSRR